jgi:hypothetical protein
MNQPNCDCLKEAVEKKHKCTGITVVSVEGYIESSFEFTKTNSAGQHHYSVFLKSNYCPQCGKEFTDEDEFYDLVKE